jgi:hypothetical protein
MGGSRQGELFAPTAALVAGCANSEDATEVPLQRHQLQEWQRAVAAHQARLFAGGGEGVHQAALFEAPEAGASARARLGINPLELRAQPLSFWRWPDPPQRGAALYFVLDSVVLEGPQPLLLYVGETGRADRRWKGEHDCKQYLAAYSEALARVDLGSQLSIRFWLDVPEATRARRALEQALIQRWLPPFNKETRQRWATPFTADGD